jgi:cellulose synthase/poly-beta-1,6-N-acetylglucosamine synthase-like glycosyltransferase
MISILSTAMREAKTIGRGLETLIKGYDGEYEVLVSIPDEETFEALISKAKELGIENRIKRSSVSLDGKPKGKPFELNTLMDEAKGDIWICADIGDSYFGENAINKLLKHFENPETFAVTGRPESADSKNNMMGYFGHLLADAAHHKRTVDLTENPAGRGLSFVKKRPFFPVSGYLFAMRKNDIRAPKDALAEDGYYSYVIFNEGRKIEYEPEAIVYVKYATNLADYFKQKKRSTGGYMQLWQYGIVKAETKTRTFWRELEYFWFPIKYAQNLIQFFWSLMLYPIRLWLWLQIYWERKVVKKDFVRTWVRIESTK